MTMDKFEFQISEEDEQFLQKFFVGPGDDEEFYQWGKAATGMSFQWLKNLEKRKIHADITLPDLAELFSDYVAPQKGSEFYAILEEFKKSILDNSVQVSHPRYIGHMTQAVPWFSVIVDTLISAMNQNQVKIETALSSTFVERQTIAWMHRLAYQFSDDFYERTIQRETINLGNTTGGGTSGNLTALDVAREKLFPGSKTKGFWKAFQESGKSDVIILASKRAHYSVIKTAAVLGLGENAVVTVPVDENNKIRLDLLEEEIKKAKAENKAILAIIGIAGTTETGNIDPLSEMASIALREKVWFHVDAAWGGSFLLDPELRPFLKGIELADSITLDGHKLFFLPMAHGLCLFKDSRSLDLLRHNAQYIIRKGSVDLGQTSIEGSRRFNALRFWFTMKILGRAGYSILLRRARRMTNHMAALIDENPCFERTSTPEVCILTYRFVPLKLRKKIKEYQDAGDIGAIHQINDRIDQLNIELQKKQRESGKSFVSRTRLESAGYPSSIVVLRIILTNVLTHSNDLKVILKEQEEIGHFLLNHFPDIS